jgi:GxxExxY protein
MGLIGHPTNAISEAVIGAAIEVHRQLGPGLLESSYQACLCRERELRAIQYQSQVAFLMEYKEHRSPRVCACNACPPVC